MDGIVGRLNTRWGWIAAGIVAVGIAGLNNEPRGAESSRAGWSAPASGVPGSVGDGFAAHDGDAQVSWGAPAFGGGYAAPQTGGYVPMDSGAGGGEGVAASRDSVSEQVYNDYSDAMRGQQRVVSENDGQTYIVDGNADPNQMTDTRDSVSGFSAAATGSEAAGYAAVEPSGATTVDTSTATPAETSSSTAASE